MTKYGDRGNGGREFIRETDLRVEVLLKLQLLFESLDAVLSINPPQHLVLQLLLGIAQSGVQLRGAQREQTLT